VASPFDNFKSPVALLRFYGVCAFGLTLDLFTKSAAEQNLSTSPGGIEFIPGWLHFEWVTNDGAVFGIGSGQRWLFVGVSVLALGFLTWLFAASRRQPGYQIILGMLLAGVLGNLYDRIMFAHVRDMIHALPRWPKLFPYVFNVADILLCTGVALMLVHAVLFDWLKERRARAVVPPAPDSAPGA
jgi:signal peptidase II